jgi:hypothetical protein
MGKRMVWRKSGLAKIKNLSDEVGDAISAAVQKDAKRLCPVKTGHLRSTIHRFKAGDTWFVTVGADYWINVEYPTKPHIIRSHGPWPLRNFETGQVFGPIVHHPGTAAQPFMRPAIYRTRTA